MQEDNQNASRKKSHRNNTIAAQHHFVLDETLPITGPTCIRVSHLLPEESAINETEWLQAAAANSANSAFDFQKDPEEDIYRFSDGRPFYDEG